MTPPSFIPRPPPIGPCPWLALGLVMPSEVGSTPAFIGPITPSFMAVLTIGVGAVDLIGTIILGVGINGDGIIGGPGLPTGIGRGGTLLGILHQILSPIIRCRNLRRPGPLNGRIPAPWLRLGLRISNPPVGNMMTITVDLSGEVSREIGEIPPPAIRTLGTTNLGTTTRGVPMAVEAGKIPVRRDPPLRIQIGTPAIKLGALVSLLLTEPQIP